MDDISIISSNFSIGSESAVIRLHLESKATDSCLSQLYSTVVSIGCAIDPAIRWESTRYISFSTVLDECSIFLLDFWLLLKHEMNGLPTLIHCILGQSRSASTVIAMIILIDGCGLEAAISHLRSVRPCISINPSFLAQLYFLSLPVEEGSNNNCNEIEQMKQSILSIMQLLRWQYQPQTMSFLTDHPQLHDRFQTILTRPVPTLLFERVILCKQCKHQLAVDGDIISVSINSSSFVEENVDDFWRPTFQENQHINCIKAPMKGLIITRPLSWMVDQHSKWTIVQNEGELVCPQATCQAVIGVWRKQCLDVITPYLLCDMFALKQNAVLLRRQNIR